MINEFNQTYQGKTVLITGHTGFKGSWLTIWLLELGAKVIGFSIDEGPEHNIFNLGKLKDKIIHLQGDIRDKKSLKAAFEQYHPEMVFHLAAQAIVLESYKYPVETFETNIIGTVNVLECIRESDSVQAAIMITSDKCYQSKEWVWGYREQDELGGFDPYSASKGCAEIVINSYYNTFLKKQRKRIASVRAGNIIGGGDWAKDRIIPDSIKSLVKNQPIAIRHPHSVRSWQHVLDPLYGYLLLGSKLTVNQTFAGAWNFGPEKLSVLKVYEIVEKIIGEWKSGSWISVEKNNLETIPETVWLNLDCSKANFVLGWKSHLTINQTIKLTVQWYQQYLHQDVYELCKEQISTFQQQVYKTKEYNND